MMLNMELPRVIMLLTVPRRLLLRRQDERPNKDNAATHSLGYEVRAPA